MINERLDSLYMDYYGDRINDIIPCGVVDEETYSSVYPKIVIILREAHMRTPYQIESRWTIPKGLKRNADMGLNNLSMERKYMYTWRQAGVWAYAIINGFDTYQVLRSPSPVAQGLKCIGMTNLKKTGGKASSNWQEISYHAKQDKELWQRELEIMNPDLILCGGTYRDVTSNLGLERYLLHKDLDKSYFYSIHNMNGKQSVILSFWHPNNRRNRNDNLSVLSILISKLKEEGLLQVNG